VSGKTGLGNLAITLSNLNQFAEKNFHHYTQSEIGNKFSDEIFILPEYVAAVPC